MASKRIYQIAKEIERDEKDIIAFLTGQGIKVGNRLSAVSEEAYNMLKEKFLAPPEPEPAPPPPPEPKPVVKEEPAQVEQAAAPVVQAQPKFVPSDKKKKKKNKPFPNPDENAQEEQPVKEVSAAKIEAMDVRTRTVMFEAIKAGNDFIRSYNSNSGQPEPFDRKATITPNMDMWAMMFNFKFEYPDSSPVRYWQSMSKVATRAFKMMNNFGLRNREALAEMRDIMNPVASYVPREVFTDEENQKFEAQQKLLFRTFGHGMGAVNDNLYDLKLYADRMKVKYEHANLLDYVTNPESEFRGNDRAPFYEFAETVAYSIRGVARRLMFFLDNKERIQNIVNEFFGWLDGYAKLKEQGADVAKLEKYLALEEKFINIVEFMAFDENLLYAPKKKPVPFDTAVRLLREYSENLDDPDAERNFKYKVRGVTNVAYKPKEYIFLYRFAGLEPNKDYRPPEEIAAAEAAAKAAEENKENPAANDEA